MEYGQYCDEFELEVARFVALARIADIEAGVPHCPDWKVQDLLSHVGFVHRWAQYLVSVRALERISARDMHLSRGPVDASWLSSGAEEVLATLRDSDPQEQMWAWGADQHVHFWARRLLHETLVHRVDLEQSLGRPSEIDSRIAIDGIDEFLVNLERAGAFSTGVQNLVGDDELLTFQTHEGARWNVQLVPDGFHLFEGEVSPKASLSAPAAQLLQLLYRRASLEQPSTLVSGDEQLVRHWLANCALQ